MTYEEFAKKFHISLTDQQQAAVKSIDRPTLLLAVPGSGKTTVLVTRLGYMIFCLGIAPEQILTVTYTVAATRDMRNRFASLFGEELAARLEFRTINGICARIIHYYGARAGKKPFELVNDEGFKARLLSAIYVKLLKEYPTESDLKAISTSITYIKNMQLTPEEMKRLGEKDDLPLADIYREYCGEMRRQSLMDYDDQMVYALTMLEKSPDVLSYFQHLYQYICVDEAQDTSKIQHRIIALLASGQDHLFMVGDEDQSIYGFRAAYPEALLSFEAAHPGAQVLLMEENFRSNAKIVEAAEHFIQKNQFRHRKTMRAFREAGTEIREIALKSRRAQYTYLAKVAENCGEETAVLYRDNESILPVVDLLERQGISYRLKNADLTFFSHRVVNDVRNIILFAEDPCDTELFMQIYYKIATYLNKASAQEACRISEKKKIPVLEAALSIRGLSGGTAKSVKSMQTHLEGLSRESAKKAVYRIRKFMGYGDYLERMNLRDGKLGILEAIAENEPSALRLVERLEELSSVIREKKPESDCRFILSTIHSSKGLEFETVYLLDVSDGIFPETVIKNRRQASEEELKTYEEERRLFYVGVTRAKNKLNCFSFGEDSTFVRELLGKTEVRAHPVTSRKGRQEAVRQTVPYGSFLKTKQTKRRVTEDEYLDKLEEIRTTGILWHKVFGEGRVLAIDGDTIRVEFPGKTTMCRLKYMMEQGILTDGSPPGAW